MTKIFANAQTIQDGYAADTDPIYSDITVCTFLDSISYQVEWTADVTGTLSVEASNNYDPVKGSGTFYTYRPAPTVSTQPAGTAGGTLIPITTSGTDCPYKFVRLKYVSTSGDLGTIDAWVNAKQK